MVVAWCLVLKIVGAVVVRRVVVVGFAVVLVVVVRVVAVVLVVVVIVVVAVVVCVVVVVVDGVIEAVLVVVVVDVVASGATFIHIAGRKLSEAKRLVALMLCTRPCSLMLTIGLPGERVQYQAGVSVVPTRNARRASFVVPK